MSSDEPQVHCELCGARFPLVDVFTHLRLIHPEHDSEPERWPDGSLVIHDDTLRPEDFGQ